MKKLTIALALILCLVLCVFSFASCGKKNTTTATTAEAGTTPAGTTAQQGTTPADTTAAATTAPATQPPHVHTPEENYTVDTEPTCLTDGEESLYCAECGMKIPESTRAIPADPDAHVVEEWTIVEPTLFDPVGSKTGTCKVCEQPINIVLNWELTTYSSQDANFKYKEGVEFAFNKTVEEIRGDKSFAPTEDDPDGNDLWFEYSLLYNKTLYDHDFPGALSEIRIFCFRESTNRSNYRGFYYLYLRDNGDGFKTSGDCPWRGHIDYSTYDTTASPPENCAYDLSALGNTLNGRTIGRYKAGWDPKRTESPYLWDAEWQTLNGWHRLGFRYHQEAKIVEGAVVYTGYTELYIDGVLCWKIDSNFKPGHKDSLVTKNLLLWTAEIDPADNTKLIYTNHDSMMVGMRMDNFTQASKEVLMAVDDIHWTCGDGFAVPVKRVENPKPVPTTLKEGVDDVIAMYYAKPGCVHEAEEDWTVVEPKSLLEDGMKAKYCKHCGERMEVETLAYEPIVCLTSWDTATKNASPYALNDEDYGSKVQPSFGIKESVKNVRGEDHFYPTEENPKGNDLLVEFSFLYNESMANLGGDSQVLTVMYVENYNIFNINLKTGKITSRERTGDVIVYKADESGEIPIGEYGWHRFGVRIHEDAVNNAGTVEYTITMTAYLDGVKILEVDKTAWTLTKTGVVEGKLFTATVNGEDLVYTEPTGSTVCDVYLMSQLFFDENTSKDIYLILGDVSFTCGTDFVQDVKPVADPAAATFSPAEGVNYSAKMYYEFK